MTDSVQIPRSIVVALGTLYAQVILLEDQLKQQPTIVDEVDENNTMHINRDVKDETIVHDGDVRISP